MKTVIIACCVFAVVAYSCQSNEKPKSYEENQVIPEWEEPKSLSYELKDAKQWLQDSTIQPSEEALVTAINRTDLSHLKKMDSIVVPTDLSGDLVYYFPFPLNVSYLKEVDKIVFFSYPTQTFAAYEHGVLVYTGPTNMGSKRHPTPTGLFFTNWKAKRTVSSVNSDWILNWNFNIQNKGGIGWHQYSMPGYPASHSCLRLREEDAKYLYNWADKWILANKNEVLVKGTPVIVFGSYDFKAPKPWLKLVDDPHALNISKQELQNRAAPFLNKILEEQHNRKAHVE